MAFWHRRVLPLALGGLVVLLPCSFAQAGEEGSPIFLPAAGASLPAPPALSDDVPSLGGEARAVIARHLHALEARDGGAAFALLSPVQQSRHQNNPKTWLQFLRLHAPALYDHTQFRFLDSADSGDSSLQRVELISRGGDKTLALFRLRPSGESWQVESVVILQSDDARGA